MTETAHQHIGIIQPEDVAKKLGAIRNHEYPELLEQLTTQPALAEVMYFLQYASRKPGGLVKFAAEMFAKMPGRFGTETMRGAKRPEYTLEEKERIVGEMASDYNPIFLYNPVEEPRRLFRPEPLSEEALAKERREQLQALKDRRELERSLKALTGRHLQEICQRAALEILPRYFEDLCIRRDKGFIRPPVGSVNYWASPYWFMDDPVAAALEMMELHAKDASKRLAMTAVTKKVFDALDYALQERTTARIEGDSRFGKTESAKVYADMRPGLVRMVRVPSSNSGEDLIRAVAEALGIAFSYGTRIQVLRERVRYVLRQLGILLILDESHYLVPQNYTKTTAPQRLNWVRAEVMDAGMPLALIHTPQTFLPDADKFVKKTGFAMQQFFGRIYRTVRLPDELPRADLIAVARIHFPEMSDDHLDVIADLAEVSENYLQTVEAVAKLARYIARREGHRRITVSDIEAAAYEVIPGRAASTPDSACGDGQLPETGKASGRAVAAPSKRLCKLIAMAMQPSRMKPAKTETLARDPLCGDELQKSERGFVLVDA